MEWKENICGCVVHEMRMKLGRECYGVDGCVWHAYIFRGMYDSLYHIYLCIISYINYYDQFIFVYMCLSKIIYNTFGAFVWFDILRLLADWP